jgi:hypothetical protein
MRMKSAAESTIHRRVAALIVMRGCNCMLLL